MAQALSALAELVDKITSQKDLADLRAGRDEARAKLEGSPARAFAEAQVSSGRGRRADRGRL